ncbi:unnamed protein product, partial [marine sediment metagenome]
GPFHIDFFRVNHSIPDGLGLIIKTDIGTVVHTGDFKFDHVPIDNKVTQFSKIARVGQEGVLALLCDSTNAEETGFTLPERDVGKTLLEKFEKASKRIIVATFSSHIHRIQQVLDVANKLEKKVAISFIDSSCVSAFSLNALYSLLIDSILFESIFSSLP